MTVINKPPRAYAAELVECWLTRQPPQPVIDSIPDNFRDMATTQARWSCRLIQYWAMRARREGEGIFSDRQRSLKNAVKKYWQYR